MNQLDIDQFTSQFGDDRDYEAEARAWRENPRRSIRRPEDFIDGLMNIVEGRLEGVPFCLGKELRFRDGELTIWAGENGVGKSLLMGELALQFVAAHQRTLIMSFEMTPARTLFRMLRQCYGRRPVPSEERWIDKWLHWLGDNGLMLTKTQSSISADSIIGITKVAATELGCRHIIIDNLMKVVAGEDDLNAQKGFITELCRLAQDTQCHIHLVAHLKKPNDKIAFEPSRYLIRGSSAISDQADNVVLVWRNKAKDNARGEDRSIDPARDSNEPDTYLRVDKQRNGEWMGKIGLWYDARSQALCTDAFRAVPDFCPAELVPPPPAKEQA